MKPSAVFPVDLVDQAESVLDCLHGRGLTCATAESCTGGLIAAALTAVPGSSDVFDRGFVTYSNAAKTAQLGVPPALLDRFGAVSAEVAESMVQGCLNASDAGLAVAVTGIAGPGGGSKEKPVGLVFLACALADGPLLVRRRIFAGDRGAVRYACVNAAFDLMLQTVAKGDEAGPEETGIL